MAGHNLRVRAPWRRAVLTAPLLMLLVPGCGGDDDSSDGSAGEDADQPFVAGDELMPPPVPVDELASYACELPEPPEMLRVDIWGELVVEYQPDAPEGVTCRWSHPEDPQINARLVIHSDATYDDEIAASPQAEQVPIADRMGHVVGDSQPGAVQTCRAVTQVDGAAVEAVLEQVVSPRCGLASWLLDVIVGPDSS